jgi:hypothetical protein
MAWDASNSYLANTCYFIPRAEKWLLGVRLSSTMLFYVQKMLGSNEGGFIRLFSIHVEKLPIPPMTSSQPAALTKSVDLILTAKQRDPKSDTSACERGINEWGYALFGLMADEIDLVEGTAK